MAGVPFQEPNQSPQEYIEAQKLSSEPDNEQLDGWSEDLPTPMRSIQEEFQTALVETVSLYILQCQPLRP